MTSIDDVFEYRRVLKDRLIRAGWDIWSDDYNAEGYLEFKRLSGFKTGRELIRLPNPNATYDFRNIDAIDQRNRERIGFLFRQIILEFFKEHFGDKKCVLVDVNHPCYYFVPNDIEVDDDYEPWPVQFGFFDYVCYYEPTFTEGVFFDPKNLVLLAFGKQMVNRLFERFPMVPIELRTN